MFLALPDMERREPQWLSIIGPAASGGGLVDWTVIIVYLFHVSGKWVGREREIYRSLTAWREASTSDRISTKLFACSFGISFPLTLTPSLNCATVRAANENW